MREKIDEFNNDLVRHLREAYALAADESHLGRLSLLLKGTAEGAKAIGVYAEQYDQSSITEDLDRATARYVHYEWMPEAKALLILIRDTLFQYQKGLILLGSGKMSQSGLEYLKARSYETLEGAVRQWQMSPWPQRSPQEAQLYLEEVSLMSNPWSVYQGQFKEMSDQADTLIDQYRHVAKSGQDIRAISSRCKLVLTNMIKEMRRMLDIRDQLLTTVDSELPEHPQKIIKLLEQAETQVVPFNHYSSCAVSIEQISGQMEREVQVPYTIQGGQLVCKDINFSQDALSWTESDVLPSILDAQELIDMVGNNIKMALVNMKNRLAIIQVDQGDAVPTAEEVNQPLQNLQDTLLDRQHSLEYLISQIEERVDEHLKIDRIYEAEHNFLMVDQQYAISQLTKDQTAWVQSIRDWVGERTHHTKKLMSRISEEDALSISERIVRFVQSRYLPESNQQYSGIFSAHGYIGESFWAGRQSELNHIAQLIHNWRLGYRGSVVVSGKRFAGKTVFGEVVSHRYFPLKTISLIPNTSVEVNGRTLEITHDLNAALEFIKKYTRHDQYLIWIDDLELWRDVQTPASRNIRNLLKHIDALSAQHFFMVSMSNWFLNHYSKMFDIEKVFQAEINLDYMSEDDILQAMIIRHGATHKLLVDKERQESVDPSRFAQMVSKVSRLADHNIGESLNLWSTATHKVDDQRVYHDLDPIYQLPDFINPENSILLRAILMNKRKSEYQLRKSLGSAFTDKYKSIVQRLINVGVLTRHTDGQLELNDAVANHVSDMMHKSRYLNNVR